MFLIFIAVIAEMKVYSDELNERRKSRPTKTAPSTVGEIAPGVTFLFVDISALFVCENRNGLKKLEHLYVVGELQSIVEKRLTDLFATDDPEVTVHVQNMVWEPSDYRRCSVYFSEFLLPIIVIPYYTR